MSSSLIVTKRVIQQTTLNNNHTTSNGNDKQSNISKGDTPNINQTSFDYLFNKKIDSNACHIYNDYYFDVIIDHDNELSFIAYSTHPHILPAHWAAEHKLALMYAPERYFNLLTLNAVGNNHVETGMKMKMVYILNNNDYDFSVTLIHK
ncbi:unnamed protein product [Rotaria sordida]|uniref:Uncharacterized protein n=1 Tax=Rotaria sordida TaxID=392033 RepID=A0A814U5T0_9BILA|nr:unnamed protein product [Rotaria sordida]